MSPFIGIWLIGQLIDTRLSLSKLESEVISESRSMGWRYFSLEVIVILLDLNQSPFQFACLRDQLHLLGSQTCWKTLRREMCHLDSHSSIFYRWCCSTIEHNCSIEDSSSIHDSSLCDRHRLRNVSNRAGRSDLDSVDVTFDSRFEVPPLNPSVPSSLVQADRWLTLPFVVACVLWPIEDFRSLVEEPPEHHYPRHSTPKTAVSIQPRSSSYRFVLIRISFEQIVFEVNVVL